MRFPKTLSEYVALILVALLGVLHVSLQLINSAGWLMSDLTTLIGMAFIAAFLANRRIYHLLFYGWALIQLFSVVNERANLDFTQVWSYRLGLVTRENIFLAVNLPALIFLVIGLRLSMDSIIGRTFRLLPNANDKMLLQFLPAEVTIIRRIHLKKESSWYLVKFSNREETYALIRGKEHYFLKSGKQMIVEFWKIEDPQWLLHSGKIEKHQLRKSGYAVIG